MKFVHISVQVCDTMLELRLGNTIAKLVENRTCDQEVGSEIPP